MPVRYRILRLDIDRKETDAAIFFQITDKPAGDVLTVHFLRAGLSVKRRFPGIIQTDGTLHGFCIFNAPSIQ